MQKPVVITFPIAQPSSVTVERQTGHNDQVEFRGFDFSILAVAQFGLRLHNAHCARRQLIDALESEQLDVAVIAIRDHDPFVFGPCRGEKPARADFAPHVEINHHRTCVDVLRQSGKLLEDAPAETIGVRLFCTAGGRLDTHLLLQASYLVDDLLSHAYVV